MAKKILLIDDEGLVRRSLVKLLLKEGFEVISCESGEEAVAKIQNERFQLIVCDVRMPALDGVETLKKIRSFLEANKLEPIPEILMTGYADQNVAAEAEAMKVAEYIYKPFDLRDFLKCIRKNITS